MEQKRNYILPIIVMIFLFGMISFVTNLASPMGDILKSQFGVANWMGTLGVFANFIAYAIMGYPAGNMLSRLGYKKTALIAVSIGFIGVGIQTLSGTMGSFGVYLLGAFIAGFSMCLLNTVVNPMLNSLGKNPNQGNQLVQFGGSFNSLGATLAPVIVGGLLGGSASTIASANPVFFLAMGIFLAAFLVIFFSKLPESPDLGKPQARVKVSGAFRYRNFTFGVLAIFCYVGLEVGLANWTYQYLEKSELVVVNNVGFEAAALAGTVVGIYWLLMLVGRLLGGVVGSKISSRAMLVTAALGAMLFIVLGIFTEENFVPFIGFDSKEFAFSVVNIPLNAIFFVLCGLFASIMWGAIFNLSVTGLGKYTAVASGIFMVMVCGGGIFPAIQSVLASGSILGSFWLPFALAAYILVYAMVLSRPSKNLPEEAEVLVEE